MEIHERIKYLRKKELKLSQGEFAHRINISRSNLGNIETNKIKLTNRVLSDICRTFCINPEWITDGKEPMYDESRSVLIEKFYELLPLLTEENKMVLYGYLQRLLDEQESLRNNADDRS